MESIIIIIIIIIITINSSPHHPITPSTRQSHQALLPTACPPSNPSCSAPLISSQIQLKRLKRTIHPITPWAHTHPTPTLPIYNSLHAHPTQPTNAIRARETLVQHAQSPTPCAVNLHHPRPGAGRGVESGRHMELTSAVGRIVMAVVCGEAGGGVATAARYGRKVQDGRAGWGREGALEGRGLK